MLYLNAKFSGFLWRYLKIALAYEKADVEEFFKLRKLQIYIQAFPLLVVHLAYLLNDDLAQVSNNHRMESSIVQNGRECITCSSNVM